MPSLPSYMTKLDEILAVHSFVVVGTAATVVVICLVVLVNQNWLFGVFLTAIAFCSMFQTFLIGQVYEVTSDEFITALCFIEWNALMPRHRKMLRLILQMAQCPKLTTLGGIAPNNMNMFLQVTGNGWANAGRLIAPWPYPLQVLKQIYAILMMLLRYAD